MEYQSKLIFNVEEEINKLNEITEQLTSKIEELKNDNDKKDKEIENLRDEIADFERNLNNSYNETCTLIQDAVDDVSDAFDQETNQLYNDVRGVNSRIDNLESEISELILLESGTED